MLQSSLKSMFLSVLLVVACLGTGVEPAGLAPRPSAQSSAPEACSLVTAEELKTMLGRPFGRARQRQEPSGTSCRFAAGSGGSITVSVAASSKAEFDQFRKLLADQGNRTEPVSGVGDDAYYWDERLYVRVGSRSMAVWNGESLVPADKRRAEVLAVAKALAAKLR